MTLSEVVIICCFIIVTFTTLLAPKLKMPSISRTQLNSFWRSSAYAYLWGMLIGHWGFPSETLIEGKSAIAFAGLVVYLAVDYLTRNLREKVWILWPGFHISAGIILSAFFWGQSW